MTMCAWEEGTFVIGTHVLPRRAVDDVPRETRLINKQVHGHDECPHGILYAVFRGCTKGSFFTACNMSYQGYGEGFLIRI